MYDQLFCEGKIGTLQLKNRIVMAPMATLADSDGGFSQSQIDYYEERAKGGVGLIVTGSLAFTSKLGVPFTGIFENIKHIGKAQKLADAVHRYGAKLATVYKGNIIKNLIMDCQSYAKYRPNETICTRERQSEGMWLCSAAGWLVVRLLVVSRKAQSMLRSLNLCRRY